MENFTIPALSVLLILEQKRVWVFERIFSSLV